MNLEILLKILTFPILRPLIPLLSIILGIFGIDIGGIEQEG